MANPHPRVSNLKPFKKGSSGNPGGRTRGKVNLMAILNELLAEVNPATKLQAGRELMAAMLAEGKAGNVKATMAILDRIHGKPESRMETALYQERIEVAADRAAAAAAELAREERKAVDHEALVAELVKQYYLTREQADDLLADLDVAYAKERENTWSMTDELKHRVMGVPLKPTISNARKDQLIRELFQRHGLIHEPDPEPDELEPDPEPPPYPRCGFRELPPPMIRPRPDPPIEPAPEVKPEPVPGPAPEPRAAPGYWVDMGGEFSILLPPEEL